MADVQAMFGTLLALGIAFPGLLATIKLTMPGAVDAARGRVLAHPGRCLGRGLLRITVVGLAVFALLATPAGPLKLLGAWLGLVALAWAAVGAAGLAQAMGERMRDAGAGRLGPWSAFLAGAVAMELAAVFPAVGWFVVLPLLLATSLGAAPKGLRAPWRLGRALRAGLAAGTGALEPRLATAGAPSGLPPGPALTPLQEEAEGTSAARTAMRPFTDPPARWPRSVDPSSDAPSTPRA
jgi:hypothetical protein